MKFSQRFVGWVLVALGAVSLFVGASPIFPVWIEAFVLGGAFFAAGAWILAGKELRDTIRRGLRAWRETRKTREVQRYPFRQTGTSRRVPQRPSVSAVLKDPLLPVRILKLARQEHGSLSVAEVAMELNVPLEQAQAGLDECVRAGNALPDYDILRGLAVYKFPEFVEPDPHSPSG
ncbi:MAG: hypothetical protein ABSG21_00305 [Spirochaetia bacterium]|jgi:hypothetical protein